MRRPYINSKENRLLTPGRMNDNKHSMITKTFDGGALLMFPDFKAEILNLTLMRSLWGASLWFCNQKTATMGAYLMRRQGMNRI